MQNNIIIGLARYQRTDKILSVVIYSETIEILTVGKDCVSRHRVGLLLPGPRSPVYFSRMTDVFEAVSSAYFTEHTCESLFHKHSRAVRQITRALTHVTVRYPRALSRIYPPKISFRDPNRKDPFEMCMS